MADMSDSSEHPTETTGPVSTPTVTTAPPPPPLPPGPPAYVAPQHPYKQSRLNQVAAWVGIVAGSVFVVAVIFGTGFMVGKHTGGDRGFDRHEAVMFRHRAEPPFPMGPMGQFERGPSVFRGPDLEPPQPPQVPGAPTTPAPARP
jgi:hypothetical protein